MKRAVARLLERGAPFAASAPWDPTRRLELPEGVMVIGVGGARLGGSGRTPLAIALAHALGAAYVGHAYGASPGRARRVMRDDPVAVVGDEALVAARALEVPVVVAPSRADAIRFAARLSRAVVVDRLLQTRPHRLACSVLAHDRDAPLSNPWPFGDLVATWDRLADAADERVEIGGPDAAERVDLDGAVGGRVGLITSMARPHRVRAALGARGIVPVVHVERADHAPLGRREARRLAAMRVDAWLVDEKTAVRAPELGVRIRHAVVPSPALVERIARCARLPRP